MHQTILFDRYTEIWKKFTQEVSQLSGELINNDYSESGSLHELLESLHPIPYCIAPEFFDGLTKDQEEKKRQNIGSVTGLFFELIAASIIKGYIIKRLPNAKIELNKCSNLEAQVISRDPDIFVIYKGRYVVFELKTSPKQGDLVRTREHCARYSELGHTKYFLVGGHVSANANELERLLEDKWACFMSGSPRNKKNKLGQFPRLDDLLADAVAFLSAA